MKNKKNIEDEINEFLSHWDLDKMVQFIGDIFPILELYNVDETDDWLKDAVGPVDQINVRLIRTVYLVSRLAEFHSGLLCMLKVRYKDLWKRMEKEVEI